MGEATEILKFKSKKFKQVPTIKTCTLDVSHCLICNSELYRDVSVFLFEAQTTAAKHDVSILLGNLVKDEICPEKVHSKTICRRCFRLLDRIDFLQGELSAAEWKITSQYHQTGIMYRIENEAQTLDNRKCSIVTTKRVHSDAEDSPESARASPSSEHGGGGASPGGHSSDDGGPEAPVLPKSEEHSEEEEEEDVKDVIAEPPRKKISLEELKKEFHNACADVTLAGEYPDSYPEDGSGPSRGRTRVRTPHLWKHNMKKDRKDRGLSYISTSGKVVPEKNVGSPCECKRRCKSRFGLEERQEIFKEFWESSADGQNQVLAGLIVEEDKKCRRKDKDGTPSRRQFSRHYYLNTLSYENEVCQKMFLGTFGITLKKARIITEKKRRSVGPEVYKDSRGKHGCQKSIPEEDTNIIKAHIHTFPAYKSDYSTYSDTKYLDSKLSISEMYRLYLGMCDTMDIAPCKEHVYRKVFNESFNLSFQHPLTLDGRSSSSPPVIVHSIQET